jgi:D-sedoheptulose 7-phosphate isomerase
MCLYAHAGDLTAIGNDHAFDDIFALQLEASAQAGATPWVALSSSGNTENVRRALQGAAGLNLQKIALLGAWRTL